MEGAAYDVEQNAARFTPPSSQSLRQPPLRPGTACREVARLSAMALLAAVGVVVAVTGVADLAASPKGSSSAGIGSVLGRLLQASSDLEAESGERSPEDRWEESATSRSLSSQTCSFDEQWMGTAWDSLSKQEKDAWMDLGWSKSVWDASWGAMTPGVTTTTTTLAPTTTEYGATTVIITTTSIMPPSEQMCWQELTQDEQDAATALGYSISRWMECKRPNCNWPQNVPPLTASCLDKMKYLKTVFNYTKDWTSLSQRKRDKMVLLGWDPDGANWAAGRAPFSYGRVWSELSSRERDAAMFLGYDVKTWNGCEGQANSPCLQRLTYLEERMRSWVWEEIPRGRQERLEDLGWASRSWFEGETPSPMKAEWLGLTSQQRMSARIIGYTQDTWRRCPVAVCIDRFDYVKARFRGVGWMQMKLSERRAWMLLGHSASLWADGNLPATMQLRWEELTPEQQEMATFLGHDMETWQGCNTDWSGPNITSNDTMFDPLATVRARMNIDRPFSEISGNVYGQRVAAMPTSFIRVFEESVGRALFCGNPPLSLTAATYIGPGGEPLCVQKSNFEKEKHRVRVLNVVEGSIEVDFIIVANVTTDQDTARTLFEALERQINAKLTSPICHDKDFGRFAKAAVLTETPLSAMTWDQFDAVVEFENMRNAYNDGNMCLLTTDAKLGRTSCVSSRAHLSHDPLQLLRHAVLAALAMAIFST